MAADINIKANKYKAHNKPNTSENAKWHQGIYYPKHPEKWVTKENVYRSSWEAKFMQYLDNNPNVVRVGSEPISVPYRNPVKNLEYCVKNNLDYKNPALWKVCNYWIDYFFEIKMGDGTIKKFFVEIKPYAETVAPKPINESAKLKDKKKFNRAANTYLVNTQKWAAAKRWALERGCEFIIVTERSLEKMGLL